MCVTYCVTKKWIVKKKKIGKGHAQFKKKKKEIVLSNSIIYVFVTDISLRLKKRFIWTSHTNITYVALNFRHQLK